jgi:putative sugar O-methyltransferase
LVGQVQVDHRSRNDSANGHYPAIIERLIDAWTAAKSHQETLEGPYKIGIYWQGILDSEFDDLMDLVRSRDVDGLRRFLENIHRERCSDGLGGAYFDYVRLQRSRFYKYQFVNTWLKYYDAYKNMLGHEPVLDYSLVGNPVGLNQDGRIIPIEGIRHHYYATEILSLLKDVDAPVVCEIGGGMGGLASTVLSKAEGEVTYVIVDIPEVLLLASFMIMAASPEKTVLLYGEGPFSSQALSEYDVILMPNFMLPELGDGSVDLFFNSNSLTEMDRGTAEEYLRQIERAGRRYFLHVNHNVRLRWGSVAEEVGNMVGDEIVPSAHLFERVYKRPRVFGRLEDEVFYLIGRGRHFAYLYERKA